MSDSGNIKCVATNILGRATSVGQLIIEGKTKGESDCLFDHQTLQLKGTVNIIWSDTPCTDWNTLLPFKALSDQVSIRYSGYCFLKLFIFICGFSPKVTCLSEGNEEIIRT